MPRPTLAGRKFEDLPTKMQLALRHYAITGSTWEAANIADVTEPCIRLWVNGTKHKAPLMADHVERLRKEVFESSQKEMEDFQERMQKDAKLVWNQMMALATDEETPKQIRCHLMDSILDRAGIPRNQKSEQMTEIKTMTSVDREAMYADVLKLVKGGKKHEVVP